MEILLSGWAISTGMAILIVRGSIFSGLRESLEMEGLFWQHLSELVSCPLCLSFWTGLLTAAVFLAFDASLLTVVSFPFAGSVLATLLDPLRLWR